MPVPVGPHVVLRELEDAVLLLPAAEAEQPAAVQVTLVPGVVPGVLHLGEQVLVTRLREQFINSPQSLLADASPHNYPLQLPLPPARHWTTVPPSQPNRGH